MDGHVVEGAADVMRAGGHVPLAVGVKFGGDAGGAEGDVAGGADVAGAVEPLILNELAEGSEAGFEVMPEGQGLLLLWRGRWSFPDCVRAATRSGAVRATSLVAECRYYFGSRVDTTLEESSLRCGASSQWAP